MAPADTGDLSVALTGGRVALAPENGLHLDDNDALLRIDVAADAWLGAAWEGSPVLRGAGVYRDKSLTGHVVREPYCIVRNDIVTGSRGGDLADIRLLRRS